MVNETRFALILVGCMLVSTAAGQSPACPSGIANARSESATWVEPQPLKVVRDVVTKVIPGLGYSFERSSTPANRWMTAPRWSWPDNPIFTAWRGLTYPGAQIEISLDSIGPWTKISVHTRLLCATGQRPPATHPQDVEFDAFVLYGTHSEVQSGIWVPLASKKVRELPRSCEPLTDGDQKIDICARIAAAHPDDADAQRQYAFALARFYRASKAWQPLRRLFALEGEQRSTYKELGVIMLETNQFEEARQLHERALEQWPLDIDFHFRLARANLELRRFGEAAEGFLRVLADDTALVESHYYAAVAFAGLDMSDESEAHCRTAMSGLQRSLPKRASDAEVWLGLAYCAAILRQDREAVAYFARAERVDPEKARLAEYVRAAVTKSFERVGDQAPAAVPPEP